MNHNLESFFARCLQGDIIAAMDILNNIYPKIEEMEELEQRFKNRFFSDEYEEEIRSEDPFIKSVIVAYHHYFRLVLINAKTIDEAEKELVEHLSNLLENDFNETMDEIEERLLELFKEKGYHFLGGVTPPYRGPYIWKNMHKLQFEVELPLAKQAVTVHMMSDFLLEGWMSFATCEHKHVGGWANEEGLYCNAKVYPDLDEELFQVSYLKHEAQHLYDYMHFPNLQPKELEYRAKLVELIYSKEHTLLKKFLTQAKDDPNFPHPYASYQIIKNLSSILFAKNVESDYNAWFTIDYNDISKAAYELFVQNTREMIDS
ncbi:hypothetical protein ABE096_07735 [Robertmurraya massiliosenegalensis]|uniref:hypothetical protein n=1 Tax=Robertmurraya TaxID=2837507 RepID=UPI0039A5E726